MPKEKIVKYVYNIYNYIFVKQAFLKKTFAISLYDTKSYPQLVNMLNQSISFILEKHKTLKMIQHVHYYIKYPFFWERLQVMQLSP